MSITIEIDLHAFEHMLNEKCTNTTIMKTRALNIFNSNHLVIQPITNGANIWTETTTTTTLNDFKDIYLNQYSALPTNTKFTKRRVKEYGYVTLGRRCEGNRSIPAIDRRKILPEAMSTSRDKLGKLKSL